MPTLYQQDFNVTLIADTAAAATVLTAESLGTLHEAQVQSLRCQRMGARIIFRRWTHQSTVGSALHNCYRATSQLTFFVTLACPSFTEASFPLIMCREYVHRDPSVLLKEPHGPGKVDVSLFAGVRYNCRIFLLNKKVVHIRPKTALADDGNYR